ncbi:Fanconi anemia group D2 protein [Pseudophryne corroboree]|uniref:Fanconi anemia group D2 protein n=1 Tax=Pseudophryne corroboree TaxID=495146 RepID=UPI003081556B
MMAKRRLSKSEDREELGSTTKTKKRRISNKKLKPQDDVVKNDGVFAQLLISSGVTLKSGEQQNEIAVDQTVFQKTLQQALRKHPGYPDVVIPEFISGLESHIEDRERFRNCLLPCGRSNPEEDASVTVVGSFHDSLIKLLLGIEMLQESVINLLFEKLPEFLYDSFGSDGISIPRLIINQLKWLDLVVSGKELTTKIMQLVTVAPADVQQHIISSLPEILEDTEHNDVAKELSSLLQQNTQLTMPILDAFSSLNLSPELLSEVRDWVMSSLSAVDLEVVPVIVKFILHTVTAADALEVISELRRKLDVESCVSPSQIQATQSKMANKAKAGSAAIPAKSSHDCVTLLMEVIKSAVWFQKHVCEAWIRAIESVESSEDYKVTDFLVLLILYTTNSNSKKQVERVLRTKIRTGCITNQLLQNTFRSHTQVLMFYFPSILSLAQTLLRSAEPSVVSFGSHMYKQAFTAFDRYCQQELIGALVTHVCSGYADEVDTALDVIMDLVASHTAAVALYAVFIKGILDYLDNLNAQQIRKLFQILCTLAFSQEGIHIQDEMHIVIRKQLSSTVLKYKRIGVIGAVRMVGSMAVRDRGNVDTRKSEKQALGANIFRQVTSLLELACTCCEQSSESAAFYYDELADLVQKRNLDPQVMEYVRKGVVDDFQEDYVVDLEQPVEGNHVFPVKAMYNLEEDESQGAVVINLLPLLSHDIINKGCRTDNQGSLVSSLCLSPFFRLLRLCIEDEFDGNLDEIDALLGCPLYLTDLDVIEKVESLSKQEREFLCSLLFLALNWFREVINAFCKQTSADMKGKVLTRLQNVTWLQSVLEKSLAASPGYIPPSANFDCEPLEGAPSAAPAVTARKSKKGKKRTLADSKNASAESLQIEEQLDSVPQETQKSQPEKEKEESTRASVSLSSYRPYFRELDLEVFTVLHSGLLTRSLLDSNMCTKVTDVVQLGPAELVFLLDDLSHKMEHILAETKRAPLLKGKGSRNTEFSHLRQRSPQEVVQVVIQLLNPLCNHVENMHNYFQTLVTENHGVVDAPGVDVQEYQYMSSSYQLLLQVFHILFAWNGFSQHHNRQLLQSALGILAGRLKETDAELALDELVGHSFSYLQNLSSSVPLFSSALCLTQLLITLAEKADAAPYRSKIALIVRQFLCQSWVHPSGEREKGIRFNETLQSLLCIYLQYTDVPKAVEEICGLGVSELMNAAKDGSSTTYPTLTRQSFAVFFRVLMDKLEKCVRSIPVGKKSDSLQVQTEQLLRWSLTVRSFHILLNLIKVFDSRPMLSVCLKYGRQFVETFLKLGMPLLDCCFKKHREDVQNLLKILQLCTRQLHHVCGHSKTHQDTGLTTHVPLLKKTLELFVYRVKAMLVLNNCQEAFWLGNLKNRDLQGEEILSQSSQGSETEEEQESQLPAEEQDAAQEEESEGSDQEAEHEEQEEDSD